MTHFFKSSIGRKQVAAVSGLALVLFVIAHLLGNLTIYSGPESFNGYAHKLESLGALLWVMRLGLIAVFVTHIGITIKLVKENRKARKVKYAVSQPGRTASTKLMPISGVVLLLYIISHLLDFSLNDHHSAMAFINGVDYGLYGLVYNSFQSPVKVIWYMIGMLAVGAHLHHAVQSVFQTFGLNHNKYTPCIKKTSAIIALVLSVSFASIPLYLYMFVTH